MQYTEKELKVIDEESKRFNSDPHYRRLFGCSTSDPNAPAYKEALNRVIEAALRVENGTRANAR